MITKAAGPGRDFELLPTGLRPHYTIRLHQADTAEIGELLPGLVDDYRQLVERALAS